MLPDEAINSALLERMIAADAVDALELEPVGKKWGVVAVLNDARYPLYTVRGARRTWTDPNAPLSWLRGAGVRRVVVNLDDEP